MALAKPGAGGRRKPVTPGPAPTLPDVPATTKRPTLRGLLETLIRKVDRLMTNVAEVQTAIDALSTDLQADATAALAEFAKLEKELEEKGVEADLTPLKESIEAIDTKAKTAETQIPTE